MARRYDQRTTTFSPEGRLYQVEYALESISHAGTVVGILAGGLAATSPVAALSTDAMVVDSAPAASSSTPAATPAVTPALSIAAQKKLDDAKAERERKYPGVPRRGIVLAAEKKITSKLLEKDMGSSEKVYLVNGNILSAVAGITADANSLVSYARNAAQSHLASYNEDMPVEQLVKKVCDLKQGYTQYGGLRPFGVSFLFAGHDPHHDLQLYASDPSGNYSGWKATCIGANNTTAQSLLREDFREEMGLDEAMGLALKVLSKTMDSTSLDSEKLEFATLTIDEKTGLCVTHIYRPAEIDALLEKEGLSKKKTETESGVAIAPIST